MITTIDRYMWLRIDGESFKVPRDLIDPLEAEIKAATSRRAHGTEDAGRPPPFASDAAAEPHP